MLTQLKLELLKMGIQQRVLASRIGVSTPYLCRVVNGSQEPSRRVARGIAEVLGSSEEEVRELLQWKTGF